jgi:hypothetical protein
MPALARRAADREVRVIALRPEVAEVLRRPVNGTGGFQTLFRRLQAGLKGCILRVDTRDLDRLVALASRRRTGGYQGRAEAVIAGFLYWDTVVKPRRLKVLPFERGVRQRRLRFEDDQ